MFMTGKLKLEGDVMLAFAADLDVQDSEVRCSGASHIALQGAGSLCVRLDCLLGRRLFSLLVRTARRVGPADEELVVVGVDRDGGAVMDLARQ